MNYEEYNDYELVYLAKESNADANEILFSKYSPIVYNYSKMYEKYVKNSGLEANDLIQEGMLGLNSAINSFDESKNVLFYTYAATCIKRTMLSAIVKANRQKNKPLNDSVNYMDENNDIVSENSLIFADNNYNPEYIIESNESKENLINTAKKILTDFELRVFDLRINNFNYSEMSALLNRSNKSIDNAIRRIKMKLKKALNEKDN